MKVRSEEARIVRKHTHSCKSKVLSCSHPCTAVVADAIEPRYHSSGRQNLQVAWVERSRLCKMDFSLCAARKILLSHCSCISSSRVPSYHLNFTLSNHSTELFDISDLTYRLPRFQLLLTGSAHPLLGFILQQRAKASTSRSSSASPA